MNLYKHIKLAYRNTCIAYQKRCIHVKFLKKLDIVIAVFLYNLNKLPCTCGCYDTDEEGYEYINHTVCEYVIVCKECRKWLGFYAYGNCNIVETYTELWKLIVDEKVNIITWYLYKRFKKWSA